MAEAPSFTQRVALVGAGRVGSAVTILLQGAGADVVGVASRTDASARAAATRLRTQVFPVDQPPVADFYLIGATDSGIAEVATVLAGRIAPGSVVVHLSGAHGVEILRPALDQGAEGAALHPVASCPDVDTAIARLPGSAWGVTTTPSCDGSARELVAAVGGTPVSVDEDLRPLWHAASVMTANGLSGLLAVGEGLLAHAADADPAEVLGPLAAGSLENARVGGGGAETLTGPLIRGEVATVRLHLAAIERAAPALREPYVGIATVILSVARAAGRLDPSVEAAIRDVLS